MPQNLKADNRLLYGYRPVVILKIGTGIFAFKYYHPAGVPDLNLHYGIVVREGDQEFHFFVCRDASQLGVFAVAVVILHKGHKNTDLLIGLIIETNARHGRAAGQQYDHDGKNRQHN